MEIRSRSASKIAGPVFAPMFAIGSSKNFFAPCETAMFPTAECPAAAWDWQSRAASLKHITAAFGWKMPKAEPEQNLSSSCRLILPLPLGEGWGDLAGGMAHRQPRSGEMFIV